MSRIHGPNIVTNGLVLHLDAPNIKSYTGSGTAWNDLSNNGNNGTLISSPTYDGKSIIFNGTTQYVTFANTSSLQFLGNASYTLQSWVYPTSQPGVATYKGIINRENNAGSGRDGYNLYFNTSTGTTTQFTSERWGSGTFLGSAGTAIDASLSVNKWSFIVVTYDGTNLKMYRNAIQVANNVTTVGNITNTTRTFEVAARNGVGFNIAANIPQVSVYNRALTQAEVTKNFEGTRWRYGI